MSHSRIVQLLHHNVKRQRIEVTLLDTGSLFKQRSRLQVPWVGDEGNTLVLELQRQLSADRSSLEEDEPVVVDERSLPERLVLEVLRSLVLMRQYVNGDKLERDILLSEDERNSQSGSGNGTAEEFENHG